MQSLVSDLKLKVNRGSQNSNTDGPPVKTNGSEQSGGKNWWRGQHSVQVSCCHSLGLLDGQKKIQVSFTSIESDCVLCVQHFIQEDFRGDLSLR